MVPIVVPIIVPIVVVFVLTGDFAGLGRRLAGIETRGAFQFLALLLLGFACRFASLFAVTIVIIRRGPD